LRDNPWSFAAVRAELNEFQLGLEQARSGSLLSVSCSPGLVMFPGMSLLAFRQQISFCADDSRSFAAVAASRSVEIVKPRRGCDASEL